MSSASALKKPLNESIREFVICDSCHWCATLFVEAISQDTMNDDTFPYSFKVCPMCNDNHISPIPLQRNEAYRFFFEDKRGLDIQFLRLKNQSE